ncbi:MAG: TrkA family potassium uptake protein [Planctomycetes bacterium]|nr:TrkA family potassium uptake protein [Planctomycetota bacterium]
MNNQQGKQGMRRVAVFGLGRFGLGLAIRLAEMGADVLAVDSDKQLVEQADQRVSRAVCLDATNEFAVKKLNLAQTDLAIVCIGRNIEAGLLVTAVLQRLGVEEIWVRAIDQNQAQILEAMGLDTILSLENEMARQVAQKVMMPGIQVIAPITSNHALAQLKAQPEFVGKTLQQLDFRNTYGLNIVAIKSLEPAPGSNGNGQMQYHVNDLPHAEDVIEQGDILVVIGPDEKLRQLQTDF